MKIKITPLQAEILRHRLGDPDRIVDSLSDGWDEGAIRWHPDDVRAAVDEIIDELTDRFLDTDAADEINERLGHDILADCIESSTFIAAMRGECTDTQIRSAINSGERLAEILADYCGRRLTFQTS